MKVIGLSGSRIGSKTRIAMDYIAEQIAILAPSVDFKILDLKDYELVFSDGRNYLDYEGDTAMILQELMRADAIIIGTPIFQASLPGSLKNIFDLLPVNAFLDKVLAMYATSGTSKHYLVLEYHLKSILSYMKAQLVQSYVFIEDQDYYNKAIINDDILFRLNQLVEDLFY